MVERKLGEVLNEGLRLYAIWMVANETIGLVARLNFIEKDSIH